MDAHYCDRLRPRLQDSDAAVREHTVRTLAHIGAWGGHDALAASLMSACGDPEPAVQRAAVDALVAATGLRVTCIDLPGFGLSSRPQFPVAGDGSAAEAKFVDAIEAWRKTMQIDSFYAIFC